MEDGGGGPYRWWKWLAHCHDGAYLFGCVTRRLREGSLKQHGVQDKYTHTHTHTLPRVIKKEEKEPLFGKRNIEKQQRVWKKTLTSFRQGRCTISKQTTSKNIVPQCRVWSSFKRKLNQLMGEREIWFSITEEAVGTVGKGTRL